MPTIKQIRAVNEIVENGGNISKAMRDVGYSPGTAKEPAKLTRSKGFQELMKNTGLTDDFALSKHFQLLSDDDKTIVLRALDLYYKITGRAKQAEVNITNVNTGESLTELLRKRAEAVEVDHEVIEND